MEENMNKKSNKLLIGIIIILLIIIGCLIFIILKPDVLKFNKTKELKIEEKEKNSKKEKSIKLDNNKEYVYKAEYKYDNKYTEYNRGYETDETINTIDRYGIDVKVRYGTEYLSDLSVPYINIDSEYAKKVNKDLENMYTTKAKEFDQCAQDAEGHDKVSCSLVLTYKVFENKDVLSVVVIDSTQATSAWLFNYNIYNFDLKTGNELTFDNYLKKYNYTKEDFLSKAKEKIHSKMKELWTTGSVIIDLDNACYDNETGSSASCYDKADVVFDKQVEEGTVKYLVTDNKPSIFAIPYFEGVENGEISYYLINLE